MERTILHCDANSFFASVETVYHPQYAKTPMAVCGSKEDRHGIVLAKNDLAKRCGVKTGEVIWQAKRKCPSMIVAEPHYDLYEKYSAALGKIFGSYTDLVEPFGLDESWLDVTASRSLLGDGRTVADDLRSRVKRELGITVSVGVSFNKVFAKLGSDMKKPDATTEIPYNGFMNVIGKLPAGDMLFVGPRTAKALSRVGIYTIRDLANAGRGYMESYLGKCGGMMWDFANGLDTSPVLKAGCSEKVKSVGNGMTFRRNLYGDGDVSFAVNYLSDMVATRMRAYGVKCRTVCVTIRDKQLQSVIRHTTLERPTNLAKEIAFYALRLVKSNHNMDEEIYSLTVGGNNLVYDDSESLQCVLLSDDSEVDAEKRYALECTVDRIREKYGNRSLVMASLIGNTLGVESACRALKF